MAGEENDGAAIRLMTFVSEEQLEESRKNRGPRVEDGSAQRDKPLFEILKENKDKKDAEFNERFKHRPPKALDEDETEFLDTLEMSKREYERELAEKEAEELRNFQAAVATQSSIVEELKETTPPPIVVPKDQNRLLIAKRKAPPRPYAMVVKIKPPQAKKAKLEFNTSGSTSVDSKESQIDTCHLGAPLANGSLVSYSDESEDDD